MNFVQRLGAGALEQFRGWGHAAFFFFDLLRVVPAALRRFGLVVAQIHAIGNRSLVIILASGLAVGFVLALQMYYALVAYGAAESLGLVVNLALVRELGPVVSALLFAGRAGTSLTAEIGLMKAGEQLSAMDMMAVDPVRRILGPRFWGGVIALPLLSAVFSAVPKRRSLPCAAPAAGRGHDARHALGPPLPRARVHRCDGTRARPQPRLLGQPGAVHYAGSDRVRRGRQQLVSVRGEYAYVTHRSERKQ
jgi:hypothetical protein